MKNCLRLPIAAIIAFHVYGRPFVVCTPNENVQGSKWLLVVHRRMRCDRSIPLLALLSRLIRKGQDLLVLDIYHEFRVGLKPHILKLMLILGIRPVTNTLFFYLVLPQQGLLASITFDHLHRRMRYLPCPEFEYA